MTSRHEISHYMGRIDLLHLVTRNAPSCALCKDRDLQIQRGFLGERRSMARS